MGGTYGPEAEEEFRAVRALAAVEQPRPALDLLSRRPLPHAEPLRQSQSYLLEKLNLDCRLIIWEYVLNVPYTNVARWQPPHHSISCIWQYSDELNADCFPYRLGTRDEWTAGKRILKQEKPITLLLSCRQMYSETLQSLYSLTTFTFAYPLDLHSFQATASPEGLASARGLEIRFGSVNLTRMNSPFVLCGDPYTPVTTSRMHAREWEFVFQSLDKMACLRQLQIWLYHSTGAPNELCRDRRPWAESQGGEDVEQKHARLFDLFATAHVPDFTVNLTWNPDDLLSRREWPFRIKAQTHAEICGAIGEYLPPWELYVDDDLYN